MAETSADNDSGIAPSTLACPDRSNDDSDFGSFILGELEKGIARNEKV
jgi:hypothetical protein